MIACAPRTPHPVPLPISTTVSRSDVYAGLRAAAATVGPIFAAHVTGRPELAAMALGGWLGSLADTGGAYRARVRHMAAFLAVGSASAVVGVYASGRPWLGVPLMFVWAFGGAMARVYGDAGAIIGVLVSVTFCTMLGTASHDLASALGHGGGVAAGVALAMVLSLVLWPIRPYGAARLAAGGAFRAIAGHVAAVRAAHAAREPDAAWLALAGREHPRVRHALEQLRLVLGQTRARRAGASERADQLALWHDAADRLFALLVAIEQELAAATRAPLEPAAVSALSELEATLLAAGRAIADVTGREPMVIPPAASLDRAVVELWSAVEASEASTFAAQQRAAPGDAAAERRGIGALAHLSRAAALIEEAATEAQTLAETATQARAGQAPLVASARREPAIRPPREAWWAPIRAELSSDSVVLRHALRVGVTSAAALALIERLGLGHGLWVVTTTIILLQPYAGVTLQRGLQRVAGTVAGGIVAALLALTVREPLAIAALMFPLSVAAVAVRTVHYGAFTFFVTPVFVLMAESAAGDWKLAGVRILNTLIGGTLAFVASRVLWPSWEHRRLSAQLAAMLDATRAYLRAIAAPAFGGRPTADSELTDLRRRMGLAASNAEAAVERLAGEPRGRWADVEALLGLMAHARRLNGALVSLAQGATVGNAWHAGGELAQAAVRVEATLRDIAEAVRAERQPPTPATPLAGLMASRTGEYAAPGFVPLGATPASLDAALATAPLRAVARQAEQLRAAAARLTLAG